MAKKISFVHDGKDYTLEYTRKSIEIMERQGFNVNDISEKPMTTLPALFAGAFLAHHKWVKRDVIDEIYNRLENKQDLLQKLSEMYNEPIEALFEEPKGSEGNVSWEASW